MTHNGHPQCLHTSSLIRIAFRFSQRADIIRYIGVSGLFSMYRGLLCTLGLVICFFFPIHFTVAFSRLKYILRYTRNFVMKALVTLGFHCRNLPRSLRIFLHGLWTFKFFFQYHYWILTFLLPIFVIAPILRNDRKRGPIWKIIFFSVLWPSLMPWCREMP